jgi:hypothetical protein
MKTHQFTQLVPDFSDWKRSVVKWIAMHDVVTAFFCLVKFSDGFVEVGTSRSELCR